jgi:PIN domain nuclease of toxin-antitoxin system
MKAYILDTHAFVWWVSKPARLGKEARSVLGGVDAGRARAWIPSIVGVELTLLGEAGRLKLGVAELEAATKRNDEVRILVHDLAQASEFAFLRSLTDPFDRMVVAAARATDLPLITADATIASSGLVDVVWE